MTTNAEVNILCKLPEMRNYRYIADFRYFCLECQIKKNTDTNYNEGLLHGIV